MYRNDEDCRAFRILELEKQVTELQEQVETLKVVKRNRRVEFMVDIIKSPGAVLLLLVLLVIVPLVIGVWVHDSRAYKRQGTACAKKCAEYFPGKKDVMVSYASNSWHHELVECSCEILENDQLVRRAGLVRTE